MATSKSATGGMAPCEHAVATTAHNVPKSNKSQSTAHISDVNRNVRNSVVPSSSCAGDESCPAIQCTSFLPPCLIASNDDNGNDDDEANKHRFTSSAINTVKWISHGSLFDTQPQQGRLDSSTMSKSASKTSSSLSMSKRSNKSVTVKSIENMNYRELDKHKMKETVKGYEYCIHYCILSELLFRLSLILFLYICIMSICMVMGHVAILGCRSTFDLERTKTPRVWRHAWSPCMKCSRWECPPKMRLRAMRQITLCLQRVCSKWMQLQVHICYGKVLYCYLYPYIYILNVKYTTTYQHLI